MRSIILLCFGIFCFQSFAQDISHNLPSRNESWAASPKKTKFGEFKHFKDVKNNKTGLIGFVKQPEVYFSLTAAFEGDDTEICYGATLPDQEKRSQGVACVLKATKKQDCAMVDFKSCASDESIKPIR